MMRVVVVTVPANTSESILAKLLADQGLQLPAESLIETLPTVLYLSKHGHPVDIIYFPSGAIRLDPKGKAKA